MKAKIYTVKDILKAYEAGRKAGVRLSLDSVLSAVTLKLQDRHGMTREELNRLCAEVNADFQDVLDDRVELGEIIEAKHDEVDKKRIGPAEAALKRIATERGK